MSGEGGGEQAEAALTGEVMELLPNLTFRVKLENGSLVTAHAAGATAADFIRVRAGDKVRLALSPLDRTRGRIVGMIRE